MGARTEGPSRSAFLVMLALSDQPRHGLAIIDRVAEATRGEVRLGPGTLYEAIQRLLDGGLIAEEEPKGEGPANGQQAQRRYYALTDRGWDVLRQEVRQLNAIVDAARANPRLRKGLV